MNITGTVREAETKNPIPFAVVFVANNLGLPVGASTTTNTNGKFTIVANNGDKISAQIVGRTPVSKQVDAYGVTDANWDLPMSADANLAEATVTATKPKKINWTYVGYGALVGAILIVITKKYILKK